MDITLSDVGGRGFAVVPGFLSALECERLSDDYSASSKQIVHNKNYNIKLAGAQLMQELEEKLSATADAIRQACNIDADVTSSGIYFSTGRGIRFPWHQDHESYFIFNDHHHYLNFYIPFIKPRRTNGNLSLIPFDQLREVSPECHDRLFHRGATSLVSREGTTIVQFDEDDTEMKFSFDLESIAVTPELGPGDLLVLRGDVVHKTQDGDGERVAISLRRQSSKVIVNKDRLLSGGHRKSAFMLGNMAIYRQILAFFKNRGVDEVNAGELITFLRQRSQ